MQYKLGGAIPSPIDIRDYNISMIANTQATFEEEYVPDKMYYYIYNQENIGCCVACSLAGCRTIQQSIEKGLKEKYSVTYIYGNRTQDMYQGEGMYPREALKMLQKYGTPLYERCEGYFNYPKAKKIVNNNRKLLDQLAYPNRISTYYGLNGINEMKAAIKELHCISVMIPVYRCTYNPDKKGVINYINGQSIEGYHQIIIIGWNKVGWLAINSWDTDWGLGGMFVIPYDYPITEAWAMTDEIMDDNINIKEINIFIRIFKMVKEFFKGLKWWK